MVDNFALGLTHLLLAIAIWRLLLNDDLDNDPPPESTDPVDSEAPPASPRKPRRRDA